MDIQWNGRIRVDEPSITPEQYKMFFGRYEFGIPFEVANLIMARNAEGDTDEIVPADELNSDAKAQIKEQVLRGGQMDGTIEYEGQTLDWAWDLAEFNDDFTGDPVDREEIDSWQMEKILNDMLDKECHWGVVEG